MSLFSFLPEHQITFPVLPLGLNGGAGSIWDFVSGSYSPSPSPVFSSLTSTTGNSSSTDVTRLLRELEEAKRKIKQWEDAWHQVKQVSPSSHAALTAAQPCHPHI